MCGIAGIVSKNNIIDKSQIQLMTEKMTHRGPDATGYWYSNTISLGHKRLSIIDLDKKSNQPFVSQDERFVLVYNGEIYNYINIKNKLKHKYNFRTKSDTEVLLYAYIEWREKCLNFLNGMFAFAIWDRQTNNLFLARDRLGIKPLYYYNDNNYFIFSSEISSILEHKSIDKKVNKDVLTEYVQFQTVRPPLTLVKNIYQLMPGEYVRVISGKIIKNKYWSIFEKKDSVINDELVIKKEIRKLFYESIKLRTVSDVPLGVFLSGGIDSSVIVSAMNDLDIKNVKSLTISFNESDFDESNYAKKIAKKFSLQHEIIKVSPDYILENFENILFSFDNPSGDGINSYVISKFTRENGIKVALSGLGGDEFFCGYNSFTQLPKILKMKNFWGLIKPFRKLAENFLELSDKNKHRKIANILSDDSIEFTNIFLNFRKTCSDKQLFKLTKLNPKKYQFLSDDSKLFEMKSRISISELLFYTSPLLLRDSDQCSMLNSLELRVPYMDHNLVEYVLSVPDKFKDSSYPKKLLIDSLGENIPSDIYMRKKTGFSFPWDYWFRFELKSFVSEKLENLNSRGLFDAKEINNIWNNFLYNPRNQNWSLIMSLISLEIWLAKNKLYF